MKQVWVTPEQKVKVKIAVCSLHGRTKCSGNNVVEAQHLDAHLTILSFTHGKVSGMDSGVRVKYRLQLV